MKESIFRGKKISLLLTTEIRPIHAAETYDLRSRVLRPHDPLSLRAPSDTKSGALHIGSFLNGQLVGIGSIVPEPRDHSAQLTGWRVRGMAVLQDVRGSGAGGKILQALIDHAYAQSLPAEIWCHSRANVKGFYARFGFVQEGDLFERPGTGPHVLMVKTLYSLLPKIQ